VGQTITLAGLFLITRISVHLFGPVGFGQYQVARRTLAVIALPLMCGLGISLPRYIARDITKPERVARWLISALCLGAALVAGFLAFGTLFASTVGRWIFGNSGSRPLVLALLIASAGMFSSTLAIGAMRGLSRFKASAVLQVASGALIPLAAILIAAGRVERALIINGIGWFVMAFCVFGFLSRSWTKLLPFSARSILSAVRELWVFGAPRVPGDIALFGLFALPGYAAVHRGDIVGAGVLSVGLSLIQAIAVAFASAGFVLLPHWSKAASTPEGRGATRRHMTWLVIASAALAALGTGLMEVCLWPIASLLLGPLAHNGMHDLRLVLLGTIPYVVYLVLRDYFDAITVFPLNTAGLGAAIVIQAILLNVHAIGVPLATASGFTALGIIMVVLWKASARFVSGPAEFRGASSA
jgi:O-antigen/teichoic acid export membrane protein